MATPVYSFLFSEATGDLTIAHGDPCI